MSLEFSQVLQVLVTSVVSQLLDVDAILSGFDVDFALVIWASICINMKNVTGPVAPATGWCLLHTILKKEAILALDLLQT